MQLDLKITKVYASSLQNILKSKKDQDEVLEQFSRLVKYTQKLESFEKYIHSLIISPDEKLILIEKVFYKEINNIFRNFLNKVFVNNRGNILPEIYNYFEKFVKKSQGIIITNVDIANDLTPSEIDKIQKLLEKRLDKSIEIKLNKKPELIGGAQVRWESNLLDCSVRGALDKIRNLAK